MPFHWGILFLYVSFLSGGNGKTVKIWCLFKNRFSDECAGNYSGMCRKPFMNVPGDRLGMYRECAGAEADAIICG